MKRTIKVVLMLCALLPAALCFANGMARTEKQETEGVLIPIKKAGHSGGTDKEEIPITASINGHMLSMSFSQNIGSVFVEISDGQSFTVVTPDSAQAYITNSGSYTVNFTLANGDEYYGHFVVN